MHRLVHVLLIAVLSGSALRAQTNAPTVADLERMKLELEVERARLDADRARFEAEKAKWEAQRAAAGTTTITVVTNAFVPVYLATDTVRLYRRGQIAGELPAGSSVTALPHDKHRGWFLVTWKGQSYEADGANLVRADLRLADAENAAATARQRYDELEKRQTQLLSRRNELERQVTGLEATRRQTVVVVNPIPPGATNRPPPVMVYGNDPTAAQIAYLRNQIRDTERELKDIAKQMPAIAQARDRSEAALQRVRLQVDAARSQAE